MKNSIKFLIRLNPNYINKINDNELTEEMVLYALNCGFKYENDKVGRCNKFFSYVSANLEKDGYLEYLSKNIKLNSFDEKNMDYLFDYIKKNNPDLFLSFLKNDINFVKYVDRDLADNLNKDELYNIFLNYIKYNELNINILKDNLELAILYLKKDFSNIIDIKKYIDIKEIKEKVLKIFESDINNNIEYLNDVTELLDESYDKKNELIDALKYKSVKINENTPKFVFENRYSAFNLIINNIENATIVDREVSFNKEQEIQILNLIKEKEIKYLDIPLCFKKYNSIMEQIIINNPKLINSQDFVFNSYLLEVVYNLYMNNKFKFENKMLLKEFAFYPEYLNNILKIDFSLSNDMDFVCIQNNVKNIFDICKINNCKLNKNSSLFLKSNSLLVIEALNKGDISLDDINLSNVIFSNNVAKEKIEFINYAISKNINDNETINEWRNDLIKSVLTSKNGGRLYIKDSFYKKIDIPSDVEEVFFDKIDIDTLNKLIDTVNNSNNNLKRIVIDLPTEGTFGLDYLSKIKDKEKVYFGSKNDIIRFSVEDLIKLEITLDLFVKDIKESNLSPFEKYVGVYNIVKLFKEYRYYKDDKYLNQTIGDQSRNVYLIMMNDWMVCVGYSGLLKTLLDRVGINSRTWDVVTTKEGHQRNYVYLKDDKYDIDGYYMCDSTWDNNNSNFEMENVDGYSYIHQTRDQAREDKKFKGEGTTLSDELFSDYTDEEFLNYVKNNLEYVKKTFLELDPQFYQEIEEKIDNIDIELASKMNSYIKSKLNKEIETIKDVEAIMELNQHIENRRYTEEEYNQKWNDLIVKFNLSLDYIKGDLNRDLEYVKNQILSLKLKDYNLMFYQKGPYQKFLLKNSYEKLMEELRKEENSCQFNMFLDANKIKFKFGIFNENFTNELGLEILEYMKSMNLDVVLSGNIFEISLDDIFLEKNIKEVIEYCSSLKNEFLNIYYDKIGMTTNMNL